MAANLAARKGFAQNIGCGLLEYWQEKGMNELDSLTFRLLYSILLEWGNILEIITETDSRDSQHPPPVPSPPKPHCIPV